MQTHPNEGFLYFIFFQEQYKVLISKPVADQEKKIEESERRIRLVACRNFYFFLNGADFVPESKFHHCSLCGFQYIFHMLCFVSLNKCFRAPITEYGPGKGSERRILVCCFINSIKGVLQSLKKKALLCSGFKKKISRHLWRHDIPRVLETPFLFSSENTETKQI